VWCTAATITGAIAQQPVFAGFTITYRAQERLSDTVDLVCQKIAEKGHLTITFGVHPLGWIVSCGSVGKDLAARSFHTPRNGADSRKLCWRLLFDPTQGSYFFELCNR